MLTRPRAPLALPVLLALAGVAACGHDRAPEPEKRSVELTVQRTIVADTGPAAFGRVVDLEIGEDGEVLVLDGLNRVVQVFDRAGAHVRTLGRRGSGPGELENPSGLFVGPGERIWVIDPGNLRFTVYDSVGELAVTHRRPDPGFAAPWRGAVAPHGTFYDVAYEFTLERGPKPTLVEVEVDDGEPRVLRRGNVPTMEPMPAYRFTGGGMVLMLAVPFAPQPVFQVAPNGSLWYGRTDHPWLYRRPLSRGESLVSAQPTDSVRVIADGMEPPRVTRAELDSILDSRDAREIRQLGGEDAVSDFLALVPLRKPSYEDFFFDDAERLWVVRDAVDGRARLDVYDAAGAHIGGVTVEIEPSPRPRVRGRLLAGVARDHLGRERVVVYEIGRGARR